ncbi:hypothetical protein Gotri_020864 [Gossypium trilobum]|uniref:Uncharacterized protein n=1 Tax=Gossypium trilobum TaxID=34281 RepID=A0A7J9DB38_9ROSI|nr:hypothetical protein [Gossypium trilobum]
MEEKQNGSCRQRRKKAWLISMSSGGGGIERVVALGGALAVASLIAAFSIKKSSCSKKDISTNKEETANVEATDSCAKEEDAGEGLRFILQDSSSTLHYNSCCANHGTSKIGVAEIETSKLVSTQSLITLEENTIECERKESVSGQEETLIHDAEQESNAMTGGYGDIEELSLSVGDTENNPMNGVENESNASLEMETIEITIEDEAVDHVDAEQPMAEESSTLQSSLSSKEDDKTSISAGEEEDEEYPLMESLYPAEENEEYPLMESLHPAEENEDEEEYSPLRSPFSVEDNRIDDDEEEEEEEEDDDDGEYSTKESSFSTEEEKESLLQSPLSTEDENGENVAGMEEESSEGAWSSSPEPNTEVIWPAEMMGVLSPESKENEMNVSYLESQMKSKEEPKTAKIETYHYLAKTKFDEKKKIATEELVVMDVRKQHSAAKRQIWFWLGLVVLLLALLVNSLLQSNYVSNSVSFVFPMK